MNSDLLVAQLIIRIIAANFSPNLMLIMTTLKAHSHRACLCPSTDVDALGVNAQAFSHALHIGVDSRLRASTRVDERRRTSTDVDARPSTCVARQT